jgi:hypothetical protein
VRWPPAWELENFSHCEPLLLEASSLGMGIVQEPRVRGMSTIEAVTRQRLLNTVID